jgi:cell wall-associated NlpC family hydrolase
LKPTSHTSPRPARRRPRRTLAALAGLAGVLVATAWTAGGADAAPLPSRIAGDQHSSAVAGTSSAALAAFDTFSASGTPGDFVAYLGARDVAADTVAGEMHLDPNAVRGAWARADMRHQEVVLAALTQLGVQYRYARSEPGVAFDCSGLTAWAWSRAGVAIPHQSGAQIDAARHVDESAAVAGDLVHFPGHVMLYLGVERAIVHASNPSTDVALSFASRSVRFGDPEP